MSRDGGDACSRKTQRSFSDRYAEPVAQTINSRMIIESKWLELVWEILLAAACLKIGYEIGYLRKRPGETDDTEN